MSVFSHLLRQSWAVLWKNPSLWFFGLFLAVLGQGGPSLVFLRPVGALRGIAQGVPLLDLVFGEEFWWVGSDMLFQFLRHPTDATLLLPVAVKALAGLVMFVGIVFSMSAVPLAARAVAERKRIPQVWELVGLAKPHVRGIATVFILSSILFVVALLPLSLFARVMGVSPSALLALKTLAFALIAVVSLVIFFVALYATNAIVLRCRSFPEAVREGWETFRRHWIVSIEFGVLFYFITVLVAQFINAVVTPIVQFSSVTKIFLGVRGYETLADVVFIALQVYVPAVVSVLLLIVFAVFQSAFWALLYLYLTGRALPKRRVHFFSPLRIETKAAVL